MRNLKRVLAGVLTVAMLVVVASTTAFAATSSVEQGDKNTVSTGTYVAQKDTTQASYIVSKKVKANKTITVAKTVKINGKTLKVTGLKANAFKGAKNLKKIKINANITKVNKKAFNGFTKKQLKKIKVVVSKKAMTKKAFNAFKKKLIKKGFKAANITRK